MREINEQQILALAPNASAASNGKKNITEGRICQARAVRG